MEWIGRAKCARYAVLTLVSGILWLTLVGVSWAQPPGCTVVDLEEHIYNDTVCLEAVDSFGEVVWTRCGWSDVDPFSAYALDEVSGNTYVLRIGGQLEVVDCHGQTLSTTELRESFPGLSSQSAFTGVIESFDPFRMNLWVIGLREVSLYDVSGVESPVVAERYRCRLDGVEGPRIRFYALDDFGASYPFRARVNGTSLDWSLGQWQPAPGEPGGYWREVFTFSFDVEAREWLSPPFAQQLEIAPTGRGVVARAADGSVVFEKQYVGTVLSATRSTVNHLWLASVLVDAEEDGAAATWYCYDASGELHGQDSFDGNSRVVAQLRWNRTCSRYDGYMEVDEVFTTASRDGYSSTVEVLDYGGAGKKTQFSPAMRASGARYLEQMFTYYVYGATESGHGALATIEMDCQDWLPWNGPMTVFDGLDGRPDLPPLVYCRSFRSSLSAGYPNVDQLRAESGVHVPLLGLSPESFECYLYDLDGDAQVTRADEILVAEELLARESALTDVQRCSANVNGNDQIDIGDAISVRIVAQGDYHADELDLPAPVFGIADVTLQEQFLEVTLSFDSPASPDVAVNMRIDAVEAGHEVIGAALDGPEDPAVLVRAGTEARVVATHTPFANTSLRFALNPATGDGPRRVRIQGTWSALDGFLRELDPVVMDLLTGLKVDGPPVPQAGPRRPRLLGAHPNPFNPRTEISFELSRSGYVELVVFDSRGRRIARLLSEPRSAGVGTVHWDGTDEAGHSVGSGVYWVRLVSDGIADTDKIVLVR